MTNEERNLLADLSILVFELVYLARCQGADFGKLNACEETYKKLIQKIKNPKWFCVGCGEELPADITYCSTKCIPK